MKQDPSTIEKKTFNLDLDLPAGPNNADHSAAVNYCRKVETSTVPALFQHVLLELVGQLLVLLR